MKCPLVEGWKDGEMPDQSWSRVVTSIVQVVGPNIKGNLEDSSTGRCHGCQLNPIDKLPGEWCSVKHAKLLACDVGTCKMNFSEVFVKRWPTW